MSGTHGDIFNPGGTATVETGCGLDGDGTAAAPLAADTAAGEELWPWTFCTAEDGSTLKCEPNTGQLWTPPEHNSWIGWAEPVEHLPGGATFGPQPPTPVSGSMVSRVFEGECRQEYAVVIWWATLDVAYTADAAFRVGYLVENPQGSPPEFVLVGGVLDTPGVARQIVTGGFSTASGLLPPGVIWTVDAAPAIEVLAGQVTINSWVTVRGTINTTTDPV